MKKVSLVVGAILILLLFVSSVRYGPLMKQDEGTLKLAVAVAKLDFTSHEYVEFDETEYVKRYVSTYQVETKYDLIKKVLSDLGWSYETRERDALFFQKDKETIVVETQLFSEEYLLWDMPVEVFKTE